VRADRGIVRLAALLGAAGAAAALALVGCGGGGGSDSSAAAEHEILVELEPVGAEGASGEASISKNGDRTNVVVTLIIPSGGGEQPAAIHKGTCAKPAAEPAFELPNLQEGTGAETLDVKTEDLLDGGYSIVIRKSPEEADVTIACGKIEA
jgi:hypothetical protein